MIRHLARGPNVAAKALSADELLEGDARPDYVLHVVAEGNPLLVTHPGEPGFDVRCTVTALEAHREGGAGHLGVEIRLHDRLLLPGQGLPDERAGDEDLDHLAAVAGDHGVADLREADRLAVDQRRHVGHDAGAVVEDVLDPARLLEATEDVGRGLPALALPQLGGELRPGLLQRHVGGRQTALTLDHDELVGNLHDRGDFTRLQSEGGGVEGGVARVQADRLNPAISAGAADIDRVLAG